MEDVIIRRIKILHKEIEKVGFIGPVMKMSAYPDEPRMFRYGTHIVNIRKFTDGNDVETTASGFSFESPYLGLLKCLMEAIERFSSMSYQKKSFLSSSFSNLHQDALDPCFFIDDKKLRTKRLGWIQGFDLITDKRVLVPAQTVFYNYKHDNSEPHLTVHISTGAAGGFNRESTLLRSIYEIIERDAFMTIYLTKIKIPRIDLKKFRNKKIRDIVEKFESKNLELMVFDITNDLNIPSFLGMIIDKTGLGPSASLGLKSSLNQENAILGCIQEALHIRIWMRNEMVGSKKNDFSIKPNQIITIRERGLFWLAPNMLKYLDFLINQRPKPLNIKKFTEAPKKELEKVERILVKKMLNVSYVDITPENFKKIGCFIFRVIIPELQPLFFKESHPEIRTERIKQVTKYFKKSPSALNSIPHPLL